MTIVIFYIYNIISYYYFIIYMKKSKEELTTKEEVKMTEEKFKKQQYEYDKRSVMMAHSPALVPQLPQDIFKKIFQEKSNMNSII